MEKKKTCFYLACLAVGSLAAMMVLVLIYKFAYFNVYGIDITHYIGFNEVLASSIVPWLRILAFLLIMILIVLYFKYSYVPYMKYQKERSAGKEKGELAQWWGNLMDCLKIRKWIEKKKVEEKLAKERIKVRREKLHALRYHSFSDLFFFGLFLILFYIPYKDILQKNDDVEICLLLGLFFPIFMFFGLNTLVIAYKPDSFLKRFKKPFFVMIEMVFPYLVYAMMISSITGEQCGIANTTKPQTAFEIKTHDGLQYADSHYKLIGQVGDVIFLHESASDMIVDINKSDCDYIKYGPIQAENRSFWRRCVDVLETKKDGDVNPSE